MRASNETVANKGRQGRPSVPQRAKLAYTLGKSDTKLLALVKVPGDPIARGPRPLPTEAV